MDNTLKTGDKIIVSKLQYGARLPRSGFEIPWLNLFWYFNTEARANMGKDVWGYKRLSGYSQIKHSDIVVFNNLGKMFEFYIKRCVALPGDSLQIINSKLYINNKLQELPKNAKSEYKIYYSNIVRVRKQLNKLNVYANNLFLQKQKYLLCSLGSKQKSEVENLPSVDSVNVFIREENYFQNIFPNDSTFNWTKDNFGKLWISKKDTEIILNDTNYILYANFINKFENENIIKTDSGFYNNNKPIKTYKFKQNYYFMLGDNRSQSMDSRYWGFVPESHIVGKVVLVLFSYNEGMKWKRTFKFIY